MNFSASAAWIVPVKIGLRIYLIAAKIGVPGNSAISVYFEKAAKNLFHDLKLIPMKPPLYDNVIKRLCDGQI